MLDIPFLEIIDKWSVLFKFNYGVPAVWFWSGKASFNLRIFRAGVSAEESRQQRVIKRISNFKKAAYE